ncbi:MAG: BPSL0067 family protein [Chitinivibrionales bacterium]|nr:BPSL0067 family protein [Chitinivibrionales bacterium]
MPYICMNPEVYKTSQGSGQCVDLIKIAARAPATSSWKMGEKVRGNTTIKRGTAIATFDKNGRYPNNATGNHAAFYLSQNSDCIIVWDQWRGQPPHRRPINFRGGSDRPSNDGDAYYVIE